jgi:hypothetical protein
MRQKPRTLYLLIILCCCLPQVLAAKTHIDRSAGIKFLVPFKNARVLRGAQTPQVQAQPQGQEGAASAPTQTLVSTAIYAPQNNPWLLITVHGAAHRITRQLADQLADPTQGTKAAQAWLGTEGYGLNNFIFDKQQLRGTGDLPEERGMKSKILMQLVRDRVTVLRYNYRTAKDLDGWQTVLGSLKVGRLSKLSYQTLPDEAPVPALRWIAGALGLAALALLITGSTWWAYKSMTRGPETLPAAGYSPAVGGVPNAPLANGDEPYIPIIVDVKPGAGASV